MRARVPQDVDLEDKLIYGLSPARVGYLVIALLAGLAAWSSDWAADGVRLPLALLIVGAGGAAAWGRWRERPLDGWAADLALYLSRNYTIKYQPSWHRSVRLRPLSARSNPKPAGAAPVRFVTVSGSAPAGGVTTIAVELACFFALRGDKTLLSDGGQAPLRLGMNGPGRHPPTGLEVRSCSLGHLDGWVEGYRWHIVVSDLDESSTPAEGRAHLLITAGLGEWLCRLRRSGAESIFAIPDDQVIRGAEILREPAQLLNPDAPAVRAVGLIADRLSAAE